jgi:hypothetical protein
VAPVSKRQVLQFLKQKDPKHSDTNFGRLLPRSKPFIMLCTLSSIQRSLFEIPQPGTMVLKRKGVRGISCR